MKTWTKPYCGIEHYGELGDLRWATVTAGHGFATLQKNAHAMHAPSMPEEYFPTVEIAKAHGEAWTNGTYVVPPIVVDYR